MKKFSFFVFIFLFLASHAFAADEPARAAIQNEDCLVCHEHIDLNQFNSSVHGQHRCTSCHSGIQELPHPEQMAPVSCAGCHRIESEIYYSSDHGRAVRHGISAASCLDCHGEPHSLLSHRNEHSPVFRMNIPKTCARCHENEEKMAKYSLLEKQPLKSYSSTVHGKALLEKGIMSSAVCTDCHGSHDLHAPTNPASKIYKLNVPATCGKCHENVLMTYQRSIHGKAALAGKREAPVCTDCHGEHTIRSHLDPASSVYATVVSEKTCGHCHAAEKIVSKYQLPADRIKTYLESYHGLAGRMGVTTVANCASCHGAHDILPSSDPNSSVHKRNLAKTCGKCHPGPSEQLVKGTIHLNPASRENRAVFYVTVFYLFLIGIVIGGMVIHNVLDFAAKLRCHYLKKKSESQEIRFTRGERIQHLILTVSFFILAYTGFALKYPEAWWTLPFTVVDTGSDWRGLVHRITAVLFSALALYHVLYLLMTQRGRGQLRAMMPLGKDFSDLAATVKSNLSLSPAKPKSGRYHYVEKSEYWALVWGSAIMILTGVMLTFENFTLRHFPKWVYDVATAIHFYEAVLATLAIVIWHFYFTIFDPDHYPMNWSMTTGKATSGEEKLNNPDSDSGTKSEK